MYEFLIPVLTGISLLLAGILVGYFCWFRDRSGQIALVKQLTLENECLNSQLREVVSQVAEIQDQLQRRESKTEHLQILCNDLLASRDKTVQHASLLDSELYLTRLQLEQAKLQTVAEDKSLKATLDSERDRGRSLVCERDLAMLTSNDLQTKINGLKNRSENQESTIRMLRSKLDETLGELAVNKESRQQIRHEDREEWKNTANELQIRMESVVRQRDSAFDQVRSLTDELSRIRNHARVNEDTIRILRRERGAVLLRNRQAMSQFPRIHEAFKEEYSDADLLSKEYGGPTRNDPIRGVVFIEAPRVRDDLKKISGVAKVLEQRLNESGIYAFRQIMKWDEKAIREFSELLVFKDRIYRDDWLGQAARLYLQKQRSKRSDVA